MSCETFRKVIRAGLYNPGNLPKRLKDMVLALNRMHKDREDDFLLPFIEVLEKEIEANDRLMADKAQDPNGPTRETERKLRDDPIRVMLQRGAIDKSDEDTIEELRNLRYKLSQGLVPGGGGGTGERVDGGPTTFVPPVERLTDRQDAIRRLVYEPWVKSHFQNIKVGKRRREIPLTPFALTIMVIEGETTLRHLERQHRTNQSKGELGKEFRKALRDFAARLGKAESERKVPRRGS